MHTQERNSDSSLGLHTPMCMLSHFSHVELFVTLWTIALHAPLSMGFSRQEYWNGLLFPPLGDLPNPEIKPMSLTSPALTGSFFTTSAAWEASVFTQYFTASLCSSELEDY